MKDKLKTVVVFAAFAIGYLVSLAIVLTGILVLGVTVLRWMKVL